MRVTTVVGTPEEVARYHQLTESGAGSRPAPPERDDAGLPAGYQEIFEFIRGRAKPAVRPLVEEFARRALTIPIRGAYLAGLIGRSKNTADSLSPYFMVM